MSVIACRVPTASVINDGRMLETDFRDAWRAPLARRESGVVDLFFNLFGHRPKWMDVALIVRNRFAAQIGLETQTDAEILSPERKVTYQVGDKIGPWPIFFLDGDELVAGRDNRHLDFRVSIMKVDDDRGAGVVLSTHCRVHNTFGRCYLTAVTPFHRLGVRTLMSSAVDAQRF